MLEADLNKDGSLSLDEFIGCVSQAKAREDAREAAEPQEESQRSAAVEQFQLPPYAQKQLFDDYQGTLACTYAWVMGAHVWVAKYTPCMGKVWVHAWDVGTLLTTLCSPCMYPYPYHTFALLPRYAARDTLQLMHVAIPYLYQRWHRWYVRSIRSHYLACLSVSLAHQ